MSSLRRALDEMLRRVFMDLEAHRVQVRLLDGVDQFFMKGLYHDLYVFDRALSHSLSFS